MADSETDTNWNIASAIDSGTLGGSSTGSGAESSTRADRVRQRLDACRIGLQQLDTLRLKHQRLIQEMRGKLGFPAAQQFAASFLVSESPETLMPAGDTLATTMSPTPSFALLATDDLNDDLNSAVSHRSSLSVDSGCVSILSDRKISRDEVSCSSLLSAASRMAPLRRTPEERLAVGVSSTENVNDMHSSACCCGSSTLTRAPALCISSGVPPVVNESQSGENDDQSPPPSPPSLLLCAIESTIAPSPNFRRRYQKKKRSNNTAGFFGSTNELQCVSSTRSDDNRTKMRPSSAAFCRVYPEENTVVVDSLPLTLRSNGVHLSNTMSLPIRRQTGGVVVRSESEMVRKPKQLSRLWDESGSTVVKRSCDTTDGQLVSNTFRASRVFIEPATENSRITSDANICAVVGSTPCDSKAAEVADVSRADASLPTLLESATPTWSPRMAVPPPTTVVRHRSFTAVSEFRSPSATVGADFFAAAVKLNRSVRDLSRNGGGVTVSPTCSPRALRRRQLPMCLTQTTSQYDLKRQASLASTATLTPSSPLDASPKFTVVQSSSSFGGSSVFICSPSPLSGEERASLSRSVSANRSSDESSPVAVRRSAHQPQRRNSSREESIGKQWFESEKL